MLQLSCLPSTGWNPCINHFDFCFYTSTPVSWRIFCKALFWVSSIASSTITWADILVIGHPALPDLSRELIEKLFLASSKELSNGKIAAANLIAYPDMSTSSVSFIKVTRGIPAVIISFQPNMHRILQHHRLTRETLGQTQRKLNTGSAISPIIS